MSDPGPPGPRSSAAVFASGLPHRLATPRSPLRRRVLLLLIPGLLCVALGIGGAAIVTGGDRGSGDGAAGTAAPTACDTTAAGPEVDLGLRPRGRPGQAGRPRSAYPDLTRPEVRRLVTRAKRAGASIISTRALWTDLQQREGAAYDWRLLDLVVDEARRQGLAVRLRTGTLPPFAVDRSARRDGEPARWRPPRTTAELQRWSRHLRRLTRHVAGRVDYLEIWREPNTSDFWPPGPDPEGFARLLEASYRAVKRVDPAMSVISGGLEHNDLGFLAATYDARDDLFGEDARLFDQVGVHPYSGDRAPRAVSAGQVTDGPSGRVDRNFLGFQGLHEVMRSNGDEAVPIYIGEFGYPTRSVGGVGAVPDGTRAEHLRDAYAAAGCAAYVSALGWYAYHPSPWIEPAWTLLDRSGGATLTYQALRRRAEERGLAG